MCYMHTTTKTILKLHMHHKVTRDMILQHVHKLFISIDLVHDNQYWTILISSATGECSTDPIHRAHIIWSNKIQLQSWNYKTSCR
jgi:hypothetical protein